MADIQPKVYPVPKPEQLLPHHLEHLRESAIADEVIVAHGLRSVLRDEAGRQTLLRAKFKLDQLDRRPCLLIPILGPDGRPQGYAIRPDNPHTEVVTRPDGTQKVKQRKYENPLREPAALLGYPGLYQDAIPDPTVPRWVVEGVKKQLALLSQGELAFSVSGVDMGTQQTVLWPENGTKGFDWIIGYDSDVRTNHQVWKAAQKLARHLRGLGANVKVLLLPHLKEAAGPGQKPTKCGVDDFLAHGHTPQDLHELLVDPEDIPEPEEEKPSLRRAEIRFMSSYDVRAVHWLWPNFVPLGKFTELLGDPSLGKSLVTLDLAARVSRGLPMPDGSRAFFSEPAKVLLLTTEDDPSDTIAPRLIAAGADLNQVAHLTMVKKVNPQAGKEEPGMLTIPDDLDQLEQAILEHDVKLVIFDPTVAYLSEKTDSYKDQHVRRALGPLTDLTARLRCAVIGIRHHTKDTRHTQAMSRGGGSRAFDATARQMLTVSALPEDDEQGNTRLSATKRVLTPSKASLAELHPGMIYEVAPRSIEALDPETGEPIVAPFLQWLGASELSADQLLEAANAQGTESRKGKRERARRFIQELLANGPKAADEVRKANDNTPGAGFRWDLLLDELKRWGGTSEQERGSDKKNRPYFWYPPAPIEIKRDYPGQTRWSEEDRS